MTTATTAAKVMCKPETDYDGNTIYSVPSRSHPGDVYQVVIDTHRLAHCCCKAASFHQLCCHIRAVDAFRRAEREADAKDAAVGARVTNSTGCASGSGQAEVMRSQSGPYVWAYGSEDIQLDGWGM